VLLAEGTVECWGDDSYGELGNGTVSTSQSPPVLVSGLTQARAVSAGNGSVCALLVGGTVECWGDNSSGQLGNGTLVNSSTPVVVVGVSDAAAISLIVETACALLSGGATVCWGDNSYGAFGTATPANSSVPVPLTW
jgi:alpha-tubulin suppressor-like RCC1 family protein